jgi:hypothetical protein
VHCFIRGGPSRAGRHLLRVAVVLLWGLRLDLVAQQGAGYLKGGADVDPQKSTQPPRCSRSCPSGCPSPPKVHDIPQQVDIPPLPTYTQAQRNDHYAQQSCQLDEHTATGHNVVSPCYSFEISRPNLTPAPPANTFSTLRSRSGPHAVRKTHPLPRRPAF